MNLKDMTENCFVISAEKICEEKQVIHRINR